MTPGTGSPRATASTPRQPDRPCPPAPAATYDNAGELTSSTLAGTTTSYTYNADGQRLTAKQGTTTLASGTWNGAGQLTAYSDTAATMTAATYDGNGLRAIGHHRRSAPRTTPGTPRRTPQPDHGLDQRLYLRRRRRARRAGQPRHRHCHLPVSRLCSAPSAAPSAPPAPSPPPPPTTPGATPPPPAGSPPATPFGYAGAYTDPTGLIYLLNRYYDPATGQFLSVDPDLTQTLQPYAYTDGDPVTETDPTGLHSLLGDHDSCADLSVGRRKAKICAGVNISTDISCVLGFYLPFRAGDVR